MDRPLLTDGMPTGVAVLCEQREDGVVFYRYTYATAILRKTSSPLIQTIVVNADPEWHSNAGSRRNRNMRDPDSDDYASIGRVPRP